VAFRPYLSISLALSCINISKNSIINILSYQPAESQWNSVALSGWKSRLSERKKGLKPVGE